MDPHANDDNDDDADTTGGRIIVCAEFLIPSQTKIDQYKNSLTSECADFNAPHRISTLENRDFVVKNNMDPKDRRTNRPTDGPTDEQTDGPINDLF